VAGSAGVTPAYVGLEPTLILPIDPPRPVIVQRAESARARATRDGRPARTTQDGDAAHRRQSSARAAMTATPMASGSWMWRTPRAS
jgi:hypothetical protein